MDTSISRSPRPIRMIRAAFTPISKSTSLQDNPGQPVWYRYNSRSGLSVPHEYNNISAGLGWPVWIGFLSTWVVRMVRENSIERCDSHGYDAVMNVVDSVGKRAHFIPTTTTITALGAARLFLHNVWKLHGLPRRVVSDRGPQFVVEFTQELYRLLGITLSTTTAYHPQADGQTERVNQELEQYLRVFVNERQDDWDELLPMAEFQYNNHIHSSTQQTLFLLDTGQHPHMGFEPTQSPSHLETVNEFTDQMHSALTEAKSALTKAQDDMSRYYNRRREPAPEYTPGDKVYLDGSDIRTSRPSKKLAHRFLGPYVVERRVRTNAYRLRLPQSMSRLHPIFPVVKLLAAPPDPISGRRSHPPPDPIL